MTELITLGGKVTRGVNVAWHIRAHAPHDLDPRRANCIYLLRVISHQLERANLEKDKNLYRECVIAQVDRMSEPKIRFDCVEASILKLISAKFFHQAYTSPLLMFIYEHPGASPGDYFQGQMKLVMTITPERMEDIPGCALRMNADHGGSPVDVSQSQGERGLCFAWPLAVVHALKGQQTKVGPAGWEKHLCDLSQYDQPRTISPQAARKFFRRGLDRPYGKRISPSAPVCRRNVSK